MPFQNLQSQPGIWLPTVALVALIFSVPPVTGLAIWGNARQNRRARLAGCAA